MKKRILGLVLLCSLLFAGSVVMSQATVKAACEDAGVFYFENVSSGYTLTWSMDTKGLYQSTYSGDWDQLWEFRYGSDGYYTIAPVGSYMLALGIDGSVINGAALKCGTNTGSNTQKWSITNVGSGEYVIRSKYDPNYVIEMPNTSAGAFARMWRYIEGDKLQRWRRRDNNFLRNNVNTIKNNASLKYLTASGSTVAEQSYTGALTQIWQFTYSAGFYKICPKSNVSAGLYSSPYSNAPISLSTGGGYDWIVCQLSNGNIKICSRVNPQYVLTRKVASNGTASIVMEAYTGLNSQNWTLTGN